MKKLTMLFSTCALIAAQGALADSHAHHNHGHNHSQADDYAPIGLMGGHKHEKGEWMTSYRYSHMQMDGNRSGTNDQSDAQVAAAGFMIAPQDMSMQMHMFGLMYGLTNKVTLMAMGTYKELEMDHRFVMGGNAGRSFKTESKGFGDTKLSALYTLKEWGNHKLHVSAGVSLPTGSTDKTDLNTVTGQVMKLPYPMQLGSGTYDLLPGVSYNASHGAWAWGGQANATLRLDENDDGYTLGDEYQLTAWGARGVNDYASISVRIDGKSWGNIDGADPAFTNLNMAPTVRTNMRGGEQIDLALGLNLQAPEGKLAGHKMGVEASMPVYQDLDGIQLETDYRVMVGWKLAF